MQLSIIIVNYNVRDFLGQCLYAVSRAINGMEAEVFVVDNGSNDDSISCLAPLFPSVHFIANERNLGFAKANNQALEKCSGEFVLFLNPDTLVPENSLKRCMSFFQSHTDAGALGVRMLDGHGRFLPESKRAFPSPWVSFCKMTGLAKLFPRSRSFNRYALGYLDERSEHEIAILAGAFMMVRRNILVQLQGFDEHFFLYGEDIDLSFRITQAGWKNFYFPDVSIIHFKGESSSGAALLRVKYFYQAMLVFVQKYYRGGARSFYAVFLKLAIAFRATLSALKKFVQHALPQNNHQHYSVVVVAEEKTYNDVLPLTANLKIIGRISHGKVTESCLGDLSQIVEIVKRYRVEAILFCIGELTLQETIQIMEPLQKKDTRFLFYTPAGRNIISSL